MVVPLNSKKRHKDRDTEKYTKASLEGKTCDFFKSIPEPFGPLRGLIKFRKSTGRNFISVTYFTKVFNINSVSYILYKTTCL